MFLFSSLYERAITLKAKLAQIDYKKYYQNVQDAFGHVAKLVALLSGLLIFISSINGVFEDNFTITPFAVPIAFEEVGINGNYVAWQLSDNIDEIRKSGWSVHGLQIFTEAHKEVEEDIILFGVSLNSVKSLVRQALGISDKSIFGSLVNQHTRLLLKISNGDDGTIIVEKAVSQPEKVYLAYEELMQEAAKEVLRDIDPFILASYFWANKQIPQSIEIIEEMIRNEDRSADAAYLIWGKILVDQNAPKSALEKFKTSVALNPEQFLALTAWGTLLYREGNYLESIPLFERALDIQPEFWNAIHLWGKALAQQERHKEAIVKFKQAIELNPKKFDAYNWIAYQYSALNQIDKAIEYLNMGIEQVPEEGMLYATQAEMYWLAQKPNLSFDYLRRSIKKGFDISEYRDSEPYHSFLNIECNSKECLL